MAHAPYFSQYCPACGAYLLVPEREGAQVACQCGTTWTAVYARSLADGQWYWILYRRPQTTSRPQVC